MNITQESTGDLTAILKIDLTPEDYLPVVDSSLRTLRKNVDLKGFRKGHVPVGIVKKMYGEQVLAEELNKLVNSEIQKYLTENKVRILGNPIPQEDGSPERLDIKNPEPYTFTYELGISPEITIVGMGDDKVTVPKYDIAIEEKEVDEEIVRLQKRFGETTNPEDGVQDDDVVGVELHELDADGNVKEAGVFNETSIAMDMLKDKKAIKAIKGLKLEESATINIFKLTDKERDDVAVHFLGLEKGNIGEIGDDFKLTLKKINRIVPAELNKELFDQVFGPDEVKTEEDLKNKIKEEYVKIFERQSQMRLNYDIRNSLIDANKFDLPDEFLKRWIQMSNEKPISNEQVENEYPGFAENLRWNLIVNKLTEEQEIKVEADEIKQHSIDALMQQLGGSNVLSEEQLGEFADNMMKNQEHVQKTFEQLREEKLFDYIKGEVALNETSITFDELKALN